MPRFLDVRVPVSFGRPDEAGPDCALLIQDGVPVPADGTAAARARFALPAGRLHAPGCACCAPRGPVALALGALFLARSRGEVSFFTRVVAATLDPAGEAAVRDALAGDPLAVSRFRLASEPV